VLHSSIASLSSLSNFSIYPTTRTCRHCSRSPLKARRVESHVAHTYLLMLNQPYTISLPTKIRLSTVSGGGIIHSFLSPYTIVPNVQKHTHKSTKQQIGIFLFAPRGNHSRKTTPVQAPTHTESNNRKQKNSKRSNKKPGRLLGIRQYKMGIILFVVAESKPDTNRVAGYCS
jgi:hypothetical protein